MGRNVREVFLMDNVITRDERKALPEELGGRDPELMPDLREPRSAVPGGFGSLRNHGTPPEINDFQDEYANLKEIGETFDPTDKVGLRLTERGSYVLTVAQENPSIVHQIEVLPNGTIAQYSVMENGKAVNALSDYEIQAAYDALTAEHMLQKLENEL
jgi:hypothetical protein